MPTKAKVLQAEEDAVLAFVIKDNLKEEGYEVLLCNDVEAAFQQFLKNNFDNWLLDEMMPIKDGFSVAKKIRQKSDLKPILFLTATSQDQDKLDGFRSGGDDYITNPFNRKELVLKMEVFLRRTKKMHSELVLEYTIGNLRFSFTNLKDTMPNRKFR